MQVEEQLHLYSVAYECAIEDFVLRMQTHACCVTTWTSVFNEKSIAIAGAIPKSGHARVSSHNTVVYFLHLKKQIKKHSFHKRKATSTTHFATETMS